VLLMPLHPVLGPGPVPNIKKSILRVDHGGRKLQLHITLWSLAITFSSARLEYIIKASSLILMIG
jgi:hypothetical protein